jgi:uncharacterized protein
VAGRGDPRGLGVVPDHPERVRAHHQPGPVPESGSPGRRRRLLEQACSTAHHEFWPCELSLLDGRAISRTRILGPRQVTDTYLLALATARGGRFVTFDRSMVLSAVPAASARNLTVL